MQIPLLSGIAATEAAEFAVSYPLNLEPVAIDNKISKGQLRHSPGAMAFATGPGIDRGGVVWNGTHYRVMGTKLVRVGADGSVDTLGDVGGSGRVAMDYSFDRLGIQSGTGLYYWDGSTLTQVTDPDLGPVLDMIWIDGYFMTTDGKHVVVTELADATAILPLKYGSAEEDPDMVTGLLEFRKEAYVFGEHTIQIHQNVGGNGYPFATLQGATIPVGCVGPAAKTLFAGSFAFVGSGRGESLGVYMAGDGAASKISTRAVDDALALVADKTAIALENRVYRDEHRLFVHLPGESWVFLANASQRVSESVWFKARSGTGKPYRLRNAVSVAGKIYVGDTETATIGELREDVSTHFGEAVEWQVEPGLIYNGAKGGTIHSLELIGLPGRSGERVSIHFSMSRDGQTWSTERHLSAEAGQRSKRLQWRPMTQFRNWMGLRFRGYGLIGIAALEAEITGLAA